jgi:hypothetical protein
MRRKMLRVKDQGLENASSVKDDAEGFVKSLLPQVL